jgi:hypothetical protein
VNKEMVVQLRNREKLKRSNLTFMNMIGVREEKAKM